MSEPEQEPREGEPLKLRERAYASFTERLLAREIKPGQFVTQRELVALTGLPLGAIREMIPRLEAEGLIVGDQEPYSGKLLNHTMNRHAEADGRPYLGVEIRQDEIAPLAEQLRREGAEDYTLAEAERWTQVALQALEQAAVQRTAGAALEELAQRLLRRGY